LTPPKPNPVRKHVIVFIARRCCDYIDALLVGIVIVGSAFSGAI